MLMLIMKWGGRVCSSVFTRKKNLIVFLTAALTGGSLLPVLSPANAQQRIFRMRQYRPLRVPTPRPKPPRKPAKPKVDPAVMQLLRKMARPAADYSGEQVTETTGNGGNTSRQHISGDTRGRVRLDYEAPAKLAGDVMMRGPGQYSYLHNKSNTLDVALWPTEANETEKREIAEIQKGQIQVAQVGQETVAGRSATIIAMYAGGHSKKFWIDAETGIQLKNEHSGPNGLISRTYLTSVQVGSVAGVTNKTFSRPNQNGLTINSLFPNSARFNTVEEAASENKLPFTPLIPNPPPAGFHLSGVWVFNVNVKKAGTGSILLRYSDGVGNFSLYERLLNRVPAAKKNFNRPRRYKAGIVTWEEAQTGGGINVTYIGHLTPEQIAALHDALK